MTEDSLRPGDFALVGKNQRQDARLLRKGLSEYRNFLRMERSGFGR
jgi:hypothetical protein